ncbi:MAG: hypothetical protein IKU72_04070 [Oscillospiraceae bacterium]|nr:hypothetical protein [Oscillospiraceae bacterium]
MENYAMTGKILKIDLSTPAAEIVKTADYAELSGGASLAYRILLKELPAKLENAYDQGNVLVLAAGALTGSGIPGSCSVAVAALSPITGVPCCHQMNGRIGTMLKYAGYDAVIITGASASPVWVNINNNEVKMESATFLWGAGTHDTTAQICATVGREAAVAAIGPAGENKLDIASIVSLGGATADGLGGVMGSKNLKAIALRGTGAVGIADMEGFASAMDELNKTWLPAPGGSVVPAKAQSWSDYHAPNSWWNAAPGLYWGASASGVETGECAPGDTARMGLRTLSVVRDFGEKAADAVVRAVACPSCASGCATLLHLPALERAGLSPYQLCGCEALRNARGFMPKVGEIPEPEKEKEETEEETATVVEHFEYSDLEIAAAAASLAEDFGVGLLGGQLAKNFRYAVDSGQMEAALAKAEYGSFDWELYRTGNLSFLIDVFRRLGKNNSKFAVLGTADAAETWKFGEEFQTADTAPVCSLKRALDADKLHGAAEAALAAVSGDELRRPMTQLLDCGLTADAVEAIISAHCGAKTAVKVKDDILVPDAKAELMGWSAKQSYVASLLGLCSRLWPISAAPAKESGYTANPALTADLAGLVWGSSISSEQLEKEAQTGLTAARVLQCVHAQNLDPSTLDAVSDWVKAEDSLTEAAVTAALAQLYKAFGWNAVGLPEEKLLKELGISHAAELLKTLETAEAEA